MPPRKRIVKELDHNQLMCRTIGHAWDQIPNVMAYSRRKHLGGIRMTFRCTRCSTLRFEVWAWNGHLVQREYRYPEGYTTISREVATKETYRTEVIFRTRGHTSAQKAAAAKTTKLRKRA